MMAHEVEFISCYQSTEQDISVRNKDTEAQFMPIQLYLHQYLETCT